MKRSVKGKGRAIAYELVMTERRSMEIRVLPGAVRVFAPKNARLRSVDAFVLSREDWIVESLGNLDVLARERAESRALRDGALLLIEGDPRKVSIRLSGKNYVALDGDTLTVETLDDGEESVRELVRKFLIGRAAEQIDARLKHYIPLIGRAPNRVSVKDVRSRWGSCSNLNNLNFNYKLIMAPPGAMDYVVVHELCHLYDFNHSRAFWARVVKHMPEYIAWKKWLKQNGHLLGV